MEKAIRVVVANQPRLMRELVLATIADQADIDIVGEVQSEADIARVVEEQQPDFLIIALDKQQQRPALCDALLRRYPAMRILALAPGRNSSVCFWASLDIRSRRIEASEEAVLKVLRSHTQATGE